MRKITQEHFLQNEGEEGRERRGNGADVSRSYLQGAVNVCYNKDNMIKLAGNAFRRNYGR